MRICGLNPLSFCRYSNEIDCLARACAEPMFDNRYSLEHHNGYWFHHQENHHTAKDLPSAWFVSLLEPSVDVLRQYSLPDMDLCIATYFIIVLLPKHNNIWSSPSQLPRVRCHRLSSASWSFCRCKLQIGYISSRFCYSESLRTRFNFRDSFFAHLSVFVIVCHF
jgi:hypothetical protein